MDVLRNLTNCFKQTLEPNPAALKQAEDYLSTAATQPGFAISTLKVVSQVDLDLPVRQAAAVSFKNHIKNNWCPEDETKQPITDPEKQEIKQFIVSLMLSSPAQVRAQLSEALSLIAGHEFPQAWQNLLPELVAKMPGSDAATLQGVLQTADSIFMRFRGVVLDAKLDAEYDYCQKQFSKPALEAAKALLAQLLAPAVQQDREQLKALLSCIRLVASVFYSLNEPGLTDNIESQVTEWLNVFHAVLEYKNDLLKEQDVDVENPLHAAQAAVCEFLDMFMSKNEEEFQPFLQTFIQDVWNLLMSLTQATGQDNIAMAAIRFLTAVASSVHHPLLKAGDALGQICEKIVVPNTQLREEDEELFDMNYVEYLRRDTEGSDSDTRRRAAADLVRALADRFPEQVTPMMLQYVQQMLQLYAGNPAGNWKAKDCAVYLVLSLSIRGKTVAQGATTLNPLVPIQPFFAEQIVPELKAPVEERPVLKADALKFVSLFRQQLPKEDVLRLVPSIMALLGSSSNVVHSYAAMCIERLLSLKVNKQPVYVPQDVAAHLEGLLSRLFAVFELPDSKENEYAMRCIMRIVMFVGVQIAPAAPICLQKLAGILLEAAKNPSQPGFNHYLFETVSALIRHTCGAGAGAANQLKQVEQGVFASFELVLQNDVQEFHPYVFQILAQMIELQQPPLSPLYMQVFTPLLSPVFWERHSNIPPLIRLLQAFLMKANAEIVGNNQLEPILGIFQRLLSLRVYDHDSFLLLITLLYHVELAKLQPYLPTVWRLVFAKLQPDKRSVRYVRGFIIFLAHFLVKKGWDVIATSMNQVQEGSLWMIVEKVLLPHLQYVVSGPERKIMALALTQLLCNTQGLAAHSAQLWAQVLGQTMLWLEGKGAPVVDEGVDELEEMLEVGYSAAYAKLANAQRPEEEPEPQVKDLKHNLAANLASLAATCPGQLPQLISTGLSPEQQALLQQYCQAAGVSIS